MPKFISTWEKEQLARSDLTEWLEERLQMHPSEIKTTESQRWKPGEKWGAKKEHVRFVFTWRWGTHRYVAEMVHDGTHKSYPHVRIRIFDRPSPQDVYVRSKVDVGRALLAERDNYAAAGLTPPAETEATDEAGGEQPAAQPAPPAAPAAPDANQPLDPDPHVGPARAAIAAWMRDRGLHRDGEPLPQITVRHRLGHLVLEWWHGTWFRCHYYRDGSSPAFLMAVPSDFPDAVLLDSRHYVDVTTREQYDRAQLFTRWREALHDDIGRLTAAAAARRARELDAWEAVHGPLAVGLAQRWLEAVGAPPGIQIVEDAPSADPYIYRVHWRWDGRPYYAFYAEGGQFEVTLATALGNHTVTTPEQHTAALAEIERLRDKRRGD
jgi:hypothetical protein